MQYKQLDYTLFSFLWLSMVIFFSPIFSFKKYLQ